MHTRSVTLGNGYSMPVLGCNDYLKLFNLINVVGTYRLADVSNSIEQAIRMGYRHIGKKKILKEID